MELTQKIKSNSEKKEKKGKANPDRTWKVIGAIIIIIIIIVGFYFLLSLLGIDPIRVINAWTVHDKESCEKEGGDWGIMGLSDKEQCIFYTDDGGKVCSDSSQCEGFCLADLTEEEHDQLSNGKGPIKKDGKCAEYSITLGCLNKVENGEVQGTICAD